MKPIMRIFSNDKRDPWISLRKKPGVTIIETCERRHSLER